MTTARPPLAPLLGLGLLSIVAFGSWFYGFGVLIEPVRDDTGWAESTLTTTYGLSLLATGIGGAVAGRVIDRRGGRALFGVAAVIAPVALVLASTATHPVVFAALAIVGGGTIGAAGYYSATTAVISRIAPDARTESITALTLFGAFASPVFLPTLGWAVLEIGWRPVFRWLAVAVAVAFVVAAAVSPVDHPDRRSTAGREGMLAAIRRTGADPVVRRLYVTGLVAGTAVSVVLLYQVPAMTSAGLTLATASTLAGARGIVQLAGRLPLPPIVRRFGSRPSLRWTLVLIAVAALVLPASGTLPTAIVFTGVAGISVGALAALEGIYAAEVADDVLLGTTLGAYSLIRGVGAASGPIVAGALTDLTGTRTVALLLAGAVALVGVAVLGRSRVDV